MKLTLDFDKKEVELQDNTELLDLIAQFIILGIDFEGWKIKHSIKIETIKEYAYPYPYYTNPANIPSPYEVPVNPYIWCGTGTAINTTTTNTAVNYPKDTNVCDCLGNSTL